MPGWVLFQKGKNSYDNRDFSTAFKYFREASRIKDYPEAEYYIGQIFENEGEFPLALRQYERAELLKDDLEVKSFYIKITVKKAELYKKMKKPNLYQETLEDLLDKESGDRNKKEYMKILPERLMDKGLANLFNYYRLEGDELVYPSGELGIYFFQLSQDNNSLKYLTPSVLIIMTKAFNILRDYDPEYVFSDINSFIKSCEKFSATEKYFAASGFYRYLFYLALGLSNKGEIEESYNIFKIISDSSISGNFREISERIINNINNPGYLENIKQTLLYPVE